MTRAERDRAKAQHILKTFDFNKLFHPRQSAQTKQRQARSEMRRHTAQTRKQAPTIQKDSVEISDS